MRGEVVGQQHRLRVLEVRPAGHRRPGMRVGLGEQRLLQVHHHPGHGAGVVAEIQPVQGGDLVVAGPPGPQLPADDEAGPVQQSAFQRGVHVLVVGVRVKLTGRHIRGEKVQRGEHLGQFGVGEQARPVQHAGMRSGPGDVVRRQHPIELRRYAQRLELG